MKPSQLKPAFNSQPSHVEVSSGLNLLPTDLDPKVDSSRFNNNKTLDFWGIAASTICLVHCLFLPIILTYLNAISNSFFSILHLEKNEEYFHFIILPIILYFAFTSLSSGYKFHKRKLPLALGAVGVVLLIISLESHELVHIWSETVINTIGSICLISAHVINLAYNFRAAKHLSLKRCSHSQCSCKID